MRASFACRSEFTVFRKNENNWLADPPRFITPSELERLEEIEDIFTGKRPLPLPETRPIADPEVRWEVGTRPTLLIKDIRPGIFFRGVYRVLGSMTCARSDRKLKYLYVTDYTENPLLR